MTWLTVLLRSQLLYAAPKIDQGNRGHKIEFSFLNGNLMVPAGL
jgi:hypothetical protein